MLVDLTKVFGLLIDYSSSRARHRRWKTLKVFLYGECQLVIFSPGTSMEYKVTTQPGRNIIRTLTTGEQTATSPTTLMLQLLSSLSRELLAFRRPYCLFHPPMGRFLLEPAASDRFPRGRLSTSALNFATRCTHFAYTTVGRGHKWIIVSASVACPGRRSGIPGRSINFPARVSAVGAVWKLARILVKAMIEYCRAQRRKTDNMRVQYID